tara:strand:+ start:141 stop:566 length:426 start_codon:yes stop_codon:yes gene_type:complete
MDLVTRTEVATPEAPCKMCGVRTRSHVLERAKYAEFEEEIVVGKSDDFASNTWEEVEEITKFQMVESAVVICHKCWVKRQDEFNEFLGKKLLTWTAEPAMYAPAIKKAIQTVNYYEFDDPELKSRIKEIRKALVEAVKSDK